MKEETIAAAFSPLKRSVVVRAGLQRVAPKSKLGSTIPRMRLSFRKNKSALISINKSLVAIAKKEGEVLLRRTAPLIP